MWIQRCVFRFASHISAMNCKSLTSWDGSHGGYLLSACSYWIWITLKRHTTTYPDPWTNQKNRQVNTRARHVLTRNIQIKRSGNWQIGAVHVSRSRTDRSSLWKYVCLFICFEWLYSCCIVSVWNHCLFLVMQNYTVIYINNVQCGYSIDV